MSLKPEQNYLLNQKRLSSYKKLRSSWIPYAVIIFFYLSVVGYILLREYDNYNMLVSNDYRFFHWIKFEVGFDRLIIKHVPIIAFLLL